MDTKAYINSLIKKCEEECEVISKRDLIKGYKVGYQKGAIDALKSVINLVESSTGKKMEPAQVQIYKNVEIVLVGKLKDI